MPKVSRSPSPVASIRPVDATRRQMTASCGSCRERKIKCDGQKPTCDGCLKNVIERLLFLCSRQVEKRLLDIESLLTEHSQTIKLLQERYDQQRITSSFNQLNGPPDVRHSILSSQTITTMPVPVSYSNSRITYNAEHLSHNPPMPQSISHLDSPGPSDQYARNPLWDLANAVTPVCTNDEQVQYHGHEIDLSHEKVVKRRRSRGIEPVSERRQYTLDSDSHQSAPYKSLFSSLEGESIPESDHVKTPSIVSSSSIPMNSFKYGEAPDLPPGDVVEELVVLFFKHIHPWAPIILDSDLTPTIQKTYTSSYAHSNLQTPQPPSTLHSSQSRPSILTYAIICITLRFSNHRHFAASGVCSRNHYHEKAQQKVVMAAMDRLNLITLQALAIVGLDWCELGGGPKRWGGILSLVTGGLKQAGLGDEDGLVKELEKGFGVEGGKTRRIYHPTDKPSLLQSTDSWREIEERRRLFWLVFCLDRYASVSTGWDFAFPEEDIKRRLPGKDDAWISGPNQELPPLISQPLPPPSLASPICTYAYLVSITYQLGKIHSFIRTPLDLFEPVETSLWYDRFRQFEDDLKNWWKCLPDDVKIVGSGRWQGEDHDAALKALILTVYHATVIRLQSASAYPPVSSPTFLPSEAAASKCILAAKSSAQVAVLVGRHAAVGGSTFVGEIDVKNIHPLFGWTLWVAARALVAHSYIKRVGLLPETAIFVETLQGLSVYWSTAKRYAKILSAAVFEANQLQPSSIFSAVIGSPLSSCGLGGGTYGDSSSTGRAGNSEMTMNILADMRRTAWNAAAALRDEEREGNLKGAGLGLDDGGEDEGNSTSEWRENIEDGINQSMRSGVSARLVGVASPGTTFRSSNLRGSLASGEGMNVLPHLWTETSSNKLPPLENLTGSGRSPMMSSIRSGAASDGLSHSGFDFSGDWIGDMFSFFDVPAMSLPPSPAPFT
ncbi:Zn(2)-C6 fungal-type DNA-binding domain [Phaffia rhodozyma]|uniref:Zn(2)-C6 fungal-type DNA-binding domain n=1 Tax=Phaffia rhodozyma TaxID=264483 RepID=A0A0F7SFB5_PHARH|nr:Zn(2)-C6 fungal-type DNA-binding domain [Phaffia rhodozyma]